MHGEWDCCSLGRVARGNAPPPDVENSQVHQPPTPSLLMSAGVKKLMEKFAGVGLHHTRWRRKLRGRGAGKEVIEGRVAVRDITCWPGMGRYPARREPP